MKLKFTKMHGLGNDFVLVDCRESDPGNWTELAQRLADRHFGIGCDQVLLLRDSEVADYRMEIINADGSQVEMCGNGIRCFALYLKDNGLITGDEARVETLAGLQVCKLYGDLVEVDMGEPELEGRRIPVDADGVVKEYPLLLGDTSVLVTCVSMGNPHAVIFVDDAERYPVAEMGPQIENHPFFPRRTNVEFVEALSRTRLRMRVWERGSGQTLACGTGACATAVAAFWTGRAERESEVILDGGTLKINWEAESNHVFMTGPAATVFEGEFYL
ncbi:diaminopimelate epimerase [bacterium]|nr:MAG: diaminopimelate epimerase [bacterium]